MRMTHSRLRGDRGRAIASDGNLITSSTDTGTSYAKYDTDLSGLIELCDTLPTLKHPIELDLSNCGLSVKGVNLVAKAISAGAALTKVAIRGAKIDQKCYDDLKGAAPEGCEVILPSHVMRTL